MVLIVVPHRFGLRSALSNVLHGPQNILQQVLWASSGNHLHCLAITRPRLPLWHCGPSTHPLLSIARVLPQKASSQVRLPPLSRGGGSSVVAPDSADFSSVVGICHYERWSLYSSSGALPLRYHPTGVTPYFRRTHHGPSPAFPCPLSILRCEMGGVAFAVGSSARSGSTLVPATG